MQRNYIVFVLLSALVLAGWYWFVAPTDKQKKGTDEKKIAKVEQPKTIEKKPEVKEPKKDPQAEKKLIAPVKEVATEPLKTETLGGDGYHLLVDTISRGAGVRRLVLRRFNAADWRGRPTDPPRELELIQDDEHSPSYRMYHYANPGDQNPVLGLGEKIWKFEGRDELPDKVQEVRYSTTVPGLEHIKIVKTYRLAPTDYHVTLLLEFHDLRDADKKDWVEFPFRYQLVGAQGLPIEGEWYASTFRNALIGMTDKSNNLHRQLEDSLRIANRKGGDRFPEANRGDFKMQYAGVANQYFAAMIVVDDKQPKPDDGGHDPSKILAWARPTLETTERPGKIIRMNLTDHETWFQENFLTYKLTEKAQAQVEAIKLIGPREMILSYRYNNKGVRVATWVRAIGEPRPDFDEKEESIDMHGLVRKVAGKEIVFMEDAQRYHLLPRTEQHFRDLNLQDGQAVALDYYVKPDGKRVATWVRLGESPRPQFDDITVRVNSEPIPLAPRDKVAHQFLLYHGPIKAALLAQQSGDHEVPTETVLRYTDTLHLSTLTDYRSDNFFGKISNFIGLTNLIIYVTRFMHWLFYFLHVYAYLPYGLCIMVLTVVVRGCMFPISRRQAMFSIKMQALAPEMKKIAEKYKDDLQARSQATSELQKKHGVHPLSSCWPVFLQMPIFLGLYFAMQESIHFRLANFLWIENLAAPDMLIWWTEHIPWISTPDSLGNMLYLGPFFNILPMIAVALMMVQQIQTMPPPTDEQQATQQKMMKYMTIVFGVMFYKVAAGLCIYFIASSLWGCAERMLLPKKKSPPTSGIGGAGDTDGTAGTPVPPPAPPQNNKWKNKNAKPVKKEEIGVKAKMMAWWQEVRRQAEKK
jgi:YidC/Oxa1 family membrane protein insertase